MLLAVDTSTKYMGIALRDEHQILSEMMVRTRNYHTVELGQSVDRMLRRQEVGPEDLQALGVAVGPGSFTGLRIGLAFIKGIAYARKLPIVGIPTLDITAHGTPVDPSRELAVMLLAGRGRLAVGWYRAAGDSWVSRGALQNVTPDELLESISRSTLVTGEIPASLFQAAAEHEQITAADPAQAVRRPAVLADLAWQRWKAGMTDEPASLSPIYLQRGG